MKNANEHHDQLTGSYRVLRKHQEERTEYEANLARRRFIQVDPDN